MMMCGNIGIAAHWPRALRRPYGPHTWCGGHTSEHYVGEIVRGFELHVDGEHIDPMRLTQIGTNQGGPLVLVIDGEHIDGSRVFVRRLDGVLTHGAEYGRFLAAMAATGVDPATCAQTNGCCEVES